MPGAAGGLAAGVLGAAGGNLVVVQQYHCMQ